jgi:hypothetical protein
MARRIDRLVFFAALASALPLSLVSPDRALASSVSHNSHFRTSDVVVDGEVIFLGDKTEGVLRPTCVLKGKKRKQYRIRLAPDKEPADVLPPSWRPLYDHVRSRFFLRRIKRDLYYITFSDGQTKA